MPTHLCSTDPSNSTTNTTDRSATHGRQSTKSDGIVLSSPTHTKIAVSRWVTQPNSGTSPNRTLPAPLQSTRSEAHHRMCARDGAAADDDVDDVGQKVHVLLLPLYCGLHPTAAAVVAVAVAGKGTYTRREAFCSDYTSPLGGFMCSGSLPLALIKRPNTQLRVSPAEQQH